MSLQPQITVHLSIQVKSYFLYIYIYIYLFQKYLCQSLKYSSFAKKNYMKFRSTAQFVMLLYSTRLCVCKCECSVKMYATYYPLNHICYVRIVRLKLDTNFYFYTHKTDIQTRQKNRIQQTNNCQPHPPVYFPYNMEVY